MDLHRMFITLGTKGHKVIHPCWRAPNTSKPWGNETCCGFRRWGRVLINIGWRDQSSRFRLSSGGYVITLVSSVGFSGFSGWADWINFFMWLELHSLVFPSWSFLRTTFPFFSTTLYDTDSNLGDRLLSRVLLSKMWSPSPISLYCADRFLSAYSFCRSFPRASLSRRGCCQWSSVILSLGMVTLGSYWDVDQETSIRRRSGDVHQELGWGQPRQCVMCGLTLEGNFVMPFSSLYLPKQWFFLSSVESRCSTQLHHYSAASRGFLSGELFLRNLESLQTMWRQISGHSHSEHFKVCHVFEKYPPWLLRRVMQLSSSTRWLRASVSSYLLLRAGGFHWESPIGRRRCQPIELWALFWTWWVRS